MHTKIFLFILLISNIAFSSCSSLKSSNSLQVNSYTSSAYNETIDNFDENINLDENETQTSNVSEYNIETEESSTTEICEETYKLSIIATGDNLIHSPIYQKASNGDGTYNFIPMYENIKDTIQKYDIAVINQETIFIEDDNKISSYPCFGTPIEMGNAIVDTGFDVVLNATNHTWDKKEEGVNDTLNFWKNYPEITVLGIHSNENDANSINIIEKNGFRLAMFNYTYGLNGFVLPEDKKYMVDLLEDKDKFISDVKSIENDVDFTICFLHIGTEYVYEPTEYQKKYIYELTDAGADIIICSHPHVIEPYEMIQTENGNSALVYYSCGNFISNQNEIPRILGGMAEINLTKTVQGNETYVNIENYDFIPVVTHYNKNEHSVYLLEDYTEELANRHTLKNKRLTIDKLWSLWYQVIEKK